MRGPATFASCATTSSVAWPCASARLHTTPEAPAPEGGGPQVVVDLARPLREAREDWIRPFERRYVEGILRRHDGNVSAAARSAGVDRITPYRLLWRHGLK